ncbi:MAG: transposase [Boseongicola sp. SB0675_bin_26]|nr:transposase [Boseongicola sp. SB0675_bin_26]
MIASRSCHNCRSRRLPCDRFVDGFACMACGHAAHAGLNAARNIRDRALRRIAPMNEASGTGAPAR